MCKLEKKIVVSSHQPHLELLEKQCTSAYANLGCSIGMYRARALVGWKKNDQLAVLALARCIILIPYEEPLFIYLVSDSVNPNLLLVTHKSQPCACKSPTSARLYILPGKRRVICLIWGPVVIHNKYNCGREGRMLVHHKKPFQVFDSFLFSPSVRNSTSQFHRSSHIFQVPTLPFTAGDPVKSLKNYSLQTTDSEFFLE